MVLINYKTQDQDIIFYSVSINLIYIIYITFMLINFLVDESIQMG